MHIRFPSSSNSDYSEDSEEENPPLNDSLPSSSQMEIDKLLFSSTFNSNLLKFEDKEMIASNSSVPDPAQILQTPRLYQEEIFRKAISHNIIAVLDTGSGKTLIAVMLLVHVHSQNTAGIDVNDSRNCDQSENTDLKLENTTTECISIEKKVSVFLVPTVPLVSQQASYLSSNCLLRVGQIWGGSESSIDLERWQYLFNTYDVIVLTPAILLQALDNGYAHMKHLNLLIFDECHHARQLHPYSLIMKLHYNECDIEHRPKIFGMTASPVSGKDDAEESIKHLEKILASSVISSSSIELKQFVASPEEKLVTFSNGDFFLPPPLYFRLVSEFSCLASHLESEMAEALGFCDFLGTWASERALELSIEDFSNILRRRIRYLRMTNIVTETEGKNDDYQENPQEIKKKIKIPNPIPKNVSWNRSFSSIAFEKMKVKVPQSKISEKQPVKLEIEGLIFHAQKPDKFDLPLEICESLLDDCGKIVAASPYWGKTASPPASHEIGPKIQALINILVNFQSSGTQEDFCGIIFCKQRAITRIIEILLRNHRPLAHLKTGCLIGHGVKRTKSKSNFSRISGPGMKVWEQQQIIHRFKEGRLNILVATSVAEEGLDIRPCSCVVRFDICDMNLLSYMQSRGRARHISSQFIFIAEKNDPGILPLIEILKKTEKQMRTVISTREVDLHKHQLIKNSDSILSESLEDDIHNSYIYRVASTGASVTLFNSSQLLAAFCSALPRDQFFKPNVDYMFAESEHGYNGLLIMPRCFRHDNYIIKGDVCWKSKSSAKKEVAFKMIKLLYESGELNDHLKPSWYSPKSKKVFVNTHNSIYEVTKYDENISQLEKKQVRSHSVKLPSYFLGKFDTSPLFLNIIQIDSSADHQKQFLSVGFISFLKVSKNISEFPFLINNQTYHISIITVQESFHATDLEISLFRRFHFEFSSAILRTELQESASWATLCIPLLSGDNTMPSFDPLILPKYLIDWEALQFCQDMNRNDLSFLNGHPEAAHEFVLFDRYRYRRNYFLSEIFTGLNPETELEIGSCGTFKCISDFYKGRLGCTEIIDPSQEMIRANPIGYPFHSIKPKVSFQEVLLIPQLCSVCPIKRHHLKSALFFPIILRQITHRMLMQDILDGFYFSGSPIQLNISLELLSEAFTTPSAALSMNYERLETLGDSFLKIHLSLHLFVLYPSRHEGFLTNARMQIENNSFLRKTANNLQIEPFILSNPFSRMNYSPPVLNGHTEQLISDKTVADVVEAVIGASFIDGGILKAAETVTFFLGLEFMTWEKYQQSWLEKMTLNSNTIDSVSLAFCTSIASKIGYTFQNTALLLEALTHSSAITGGASYERLEFLGDAILGFAVTKRIFKIGNLSPGQITDLRRELVSNQFLGCISYFLGLHLSLNHTSEILLNAMSTWGSSFAKKLDESSHAMQSALENGEPLVDEEILLFWNRMEPSPKVMGDIFEAILGAVFVDSGFQMEQIDLVLENVMFSCWWPRFSGLMEKDKGLQIKHPMRTLIDIIHSLKCRHFSSESEKHLDGLNECKFFFHSIIIASAKCENKKTSRKNAAIIAVRFLQTKLDTVKDLCDCHKDSNLNGDVDEDIIDYNEESCKHLKASVKRKWIG